MNRIRTRFRRGKCEWTETATRFSQLRRRLPSGLRFYFFLKWPFAKTVRCNETATRVGVCDHFAGYNGLSVCDEHLLDIEQSNRLDELIKSGELDRQLREHRKGDQEA